VIRFFKMMMHHLKPIENHSSRRKSARGLLLSITGRLGMPRFFNPRRIAQPASRYSQGVVHSASARRLVISGQVGVRLDGTIAETLEEQMEIAWDNLIEVLNEGGMTVADLIKVVTFVAVPGSVSLARTIRVKKLGNHAPASTYLEVAGLATPQFLFEVEGEAVCEDPAGIFDEFAGIETRQRVFIPRS
jgi:2-iminobutanoate/2-iminopropanoate deaminase